MAQEQDQIQFAPKEHQNSKGFSPNNHFELNLKFGSKINFNSSKVQNRKCPITYW